MSLTLGTRLEATFQITFPTGGFGGLVTKPWSERRRTTDKLQPQAEVVFNRDKVRSQGVDLSETGADLATLVGADYVNRLSIQTLVGLVSKNGILIVEFANQLQEAGRDKLGAIIEAAGTRLRPILMTTASTVVGHLPLVIATGPGAGARNSIGIMLVTGMIIGTAFTLLVVPSIYVVVAGTRKATVSAETTGREPAVPELVEVV